MKAADVRYEPYDYLTFIYFFLLTFILLFFGGLEYRIITNLVLISLLVILSMLIIRNFHKEQHGIRAFIRMTYPLLLITFIYEQVGQFINIIHPGFFDYQIIKFEEAIFGNNPTILLQQISHPLLNEFFHLCYFSYFFLLLVLGIHLFLRREYAVIDKTVTASTIAYYVSYITFILYPVEGPRLAFAGQYSMKLDGFLFVPLSNFVINSAGLHGGCMPSSHVAVALVTVLISRKYAPKLYPYYLILTSGLLIGTFWGRFHYVSDAVAGAILGFLAVWISEWIYSKLWTNS
ncbi:MAG: phosphatase PAP2 family protein [candidate division Zixibacteria bacterium]|nr:phosphatase PAP2 family protein [candidate division Zixibacteria bacterium]